LAVFTWPGRNRLRLYAFCDARIGKGRDFWGGGLDFMAHERDALILWHAGCRGYLVFWRTSILKLIWQDYLLRELFFDLLMCS
jgi:hypothetical protein